MVRAVLTSRFTGTGFDLAWFSCLSVENLCIFSLYGAIYIYIYVCVCVCEFFVTFLLFSELSLVGLALDLVD